MYTKMNRSTNQDRDSDDRPNHYGMNQNRNSTYKPNMVRRIFIIVKYLDQTKIELKNYSEIKSNLFRDLTKNSQH